MAGQKIINASFANLNSIEVDKNENIYITGAYNDTVNFAADWGGNDIKTSMGGYDMFITKINSDGSYGWTKSAGGSLQETGHNLAADNNDNLYITGTFGDTVNFAADWGGNDIKNPMKFLYHYHPSQPQN